jgi:TonB family protein
MSDDLQLLTFRFEDDKASHRRREAYLASLVLHLLLIIFILVSPKIFSRIDEKRLVRSSPAGLEDSKRLGLLALGQDYQKHLQKPKISPPSDRDQIIKAKPPTLDVKKLRAPFTEKDSQGPERPPSPSLPKIAASSPVVPPPLLPPNVTGGVQPIQSDDIVGKQDSPLQSAQLSGPTAKPAARSLREINESLESPGFSIQSAIEKARQSGSYGQGGGGGTSIHNFDHRNPDFSVEQPAVVSDTEGVDFSPWLHLIYYRVRDNWYSVIPELIRTRTKGKVVLIFDVRNNGRIDNIEVLRSSGLSPYDRAAVSSVKLSEPFPVFPSTFKGEFVTVQFTYLYNIRTQ